MAGTPEGFVTGTTGFAADRRGLAEARVLCSPIAAGRIARLDTARAAALPGVLAVLTGADTAALASALAFAGQPLVAIAAETAAQAEAALALVEIALEPAAPRLDPHSAPVARQLTHPGPGPEAFAGAAAVVSVAAHAARQHLPSLQPACMEAEPGSSGTGLSAIAAALAAAAGRPVRLSLGLDETFALGPASPDQALHLRLAADGQGRILAAEAELVTNAGAAIAGAEHAAEAALGALAAALPAGRIAASARVVLTDTPPTDSCNGAVLAAFALEQGLDALAAALGHDPLDLRRKTLPDTACLEAAARGFGWAGPLRGLPLDEAGRLRRGAGIGCCGTAVAAMAEVMVDREVGHVSLMRLTLAQTGSAAMPAGAPAVPAAAARALGLALTEEAPIDPRTGAIIAPRLGSYRIATPFSLPEIDHLPVGPAAADPDAAPTVAAIVAAIATAIHDATGVAQPALPMTADRVLAALNGWAAMTDPAPGTP